MKIPVTNAACIGVLALCRSSRTVGQRSMGNGR